MKTPTRWSGPLAVPCRHLSFVGAPASQRASQCLKTGPLRRKICAAESSSPCLRVGRRALGPLGVAVMLHGLTYLTPHPIGSDVSPLGGMSRFSWDACGAGRIRTDWRKAALSMCGSAKGMGEGNSTTVEPIQRIGSVKPVVASSVAAQVGLSKANRALQNKVLGLASALWRSGWRSFWVQTVLSIVSAAALFLSCVMQRSAFKAAASGGATAALRSAFGEGLVAASFALVVSLVHLLWTWGFTRAGVRVRSAAGRIEFDGDGPVLEKCVGVRRSLDVGSSIGIVGAIAASIGLEQVLGNMVIRMLLARGLNMNFWLTNPPARLQALDLFAMQASFLVLASHLAGLLFTQRLRSKIPERE